MLKIIAILLLSLNLSFAETEVFFNDKAQEEEALNIFRQVKCLVCNGQSIAESNAEFSVKLRNQIREEIVKGKTEFEILNDLKHSFGPDISFNPTSSKSTYLLWYGPGIALILMLFSARNFFLSSSPSLKIIEVTDNEHLKEIAEKLKQNSYIIIDTEFMRRTTYYANLCVVQIATKDEIYIIDYIEKEFDITLLKEVLLAENIVKIFHASRQDLEIFYNLLEIVPTNLFDTQLASAFLGFGESISLQNLCKLLRVKNIDKSARYSNWEERPLTAEQLNYASEDVRAIRDCYFKLLRLLKKQKKLSWFSEIMSEYQDESIYSSDPTSAWKKVTVDKQYKRFLPFVKLLAEYRENKAKLYNVPKNYLFENSQIISLASQKPMDMRRVKSILRHNRTKLKLEELAEIHEILNTTPSKCQSPENKWILTNNHDILLYKKLKLFLNKVAEKHKIPKRFIADDSDLLNFIKFHTPSNPLNLSFLKGFRKEIYGIFAEKLKENIDSF